MFEFKMTVIYIPAAEGQFVILFFSPRQDECFFEVLFPTITSQPAGSSPEPAVRSVYVHTTQCTEPLLIHICFNFVSTRFSCLVHHIFFPRPHLPSNQYQLANNFVNLLMDQRPL